jgi:protein-disulfide isomerase
MRALRPILVVMALVLGASTAVADARPAAKPASKPVSIAPDWSKVVAATPEGGFRMGKAAAPVKLVEYGSLTCSHCADFARDGVPPLIANYVKTGKVSYEYRNYVLNGIDVTASLLARCAGPKGFFGMAETLYSTQPAWIGKVTAMPATEKDKLKALPEGDRLDRIAEIAGLIEVAGRYGVPAARAHACAKDQAALDRLGTMVEAAQALGVEGTPTFLLNGQNIGTQNWQSLESLLQRAGAR